MKNFFANRVRVTTCGLLIIVALANSNVYATQWFLKYGNLSWPAEKAHLFQLVVFLRENPKLVGYVAFCVGEKDTAYRVKRRKMRGMRFMVSEMNIARDRVKLIDAGKCTETRTILQPMKKDLPLPTFF